MTHKFLKGMAFGSDLCSVCGHSREEHYPGGKAEGRKRLPPNVDLRPAYQAVRADNARLRRRIRALERALIDMVEEFKGYSNDDQNQDGWREPKALQRARTALKQAGKVTGKGTP